MPIRPTPTPTSTPTPTPTAAPVPPPPSPPPPVASQPAEDVYVSSGFGTCFAHEPTPVDIANLLAPSLDALLDGDPSNDASVGGGWQQAVEANELITGSYERQAAELHSYLGPGVTTAVWMDYGKFASHEAGAIYIKVLAMCQSLRAGLAEPGWLIANAPELLRMLQGDGVPADAELAQAFAVLRAVLAESGGLDALTHALTQGDWDEVGKQLSGALNRVEQLGQTLFAGNMMIQANFGPAMDAFLKAEAAGQDGVAAAQRELAAMEPPGDPTGLFADGLRKYQEAGALAREAEGLSSPQREEQLARADGLVQEGNRLLAVHEQNLVRCLYEEPAVHAIVAAITPTLSLRDPNHEGGFKLLPEGGNWADFEARMGLERLPDGADINDAGVIEVLAPDGTKEYYRFVQPPPEGSIPAYFLTAAEGEAAARLIQTEVPAHPTPNLEDDYGAFDVLGGVFGVGVQVATEGLDAAWDAIT